MFLDRGAELCGGLNAYLRKYFFSGLDRACIPCGIACVDVEEILGGW